jgi:thioredoxin reductase
MFPARRPMGSFYRTEPMTKETTVPGVFACGDAALPMGSLPFAVADGFRAGVGAHRSLVFPG